MANEKRAEECKTGSPTSLSVPCCVDSVDAGSLRTSLPTTSVGAIQTVVNDLVVIVI